MAVSEHDPASDVPATRDAYLSSAPVFSALYTDDEVVVNRDYCTINQKQYWMREIKDASVQTPFIWQDFAAIVVGICVYIASREIGQDKLLYFLLLLLYWVFAMGPERPAWLRLSFTDKTLLVLKSTDKKRLKMIRDVIKNAAARVNEREVEA